MIGRMKDDKNLTDLIARAVAAYEAMTSEQKADHDYEQRRSFIRGMCPWRRDYGDWCKVVDRVLPPRTSRS